MPANKNKGCHDATQLHLSGNIKYHTSNLPRRQGGHRTFYINWCPDSGDYRSCRCQLLSPYLTTNFAFPLALPSL